MSFLRLTLPLCVLLSQIVSTVAPAAEAPAKPPKGDSFVFSLLPKSLQKNPRVSFNIFTEMTAEGHKVRKPTPQEPAYYIAQSGGVYNGGLGAEHNLKSPPPQKLEEMMIKALAESGYLASDETPAKPPTIVIIYHWGSHSFQPPEEIPTEDADGNAVATPSSTPEVVIRKTLLDRAMLLGGAKFTKEVAAAMEQVDQKATMQRNFSAADGGVGGSVGDILPDPFEQLRQRSAEMDRMVDELFSSSFFVVASAYDYAALAKGQRRILWRTKMTVNSIGVNMLETVPPLIASAGPYFGTETTTPVVITKRISKEGKVEVGTATVVPDSAAPAKAPATKKK